MATQAGLRNPDIMRAKKMRHGHPSIFIEMVIVIGNYCKCIPILKSMSEAGNYCQCIPKLKSMSEAETKLMSTHVGHIKNVHLAWHHDIYIYIYTAENQPKVKR